MNKYIKAIIISLVTSGAILLGMFTINYFKKSNTNLQAIVCTDIPGICFFNPQTNKFEGKEIVLLKKVAEKLNQKIDFQKDSFEKLIINMNSKADNCIGAGDISITETRKKQVFFSEPYIEDEIGIVTSEKSLPVKCLLVQSGTTYADYLDTLITQKAKIDNIDFQKLHVKKISSIDMIFNYFSQNKGDAMVINKQTFEGIPDKKGLKFITITKNQYAFIFGKKSSQKFRDKFNKGLLEVLNEDQNKMSYPTDNKSKTSDIKTTPDNKSDSHIDDEETPNIKVVFSPKK